MSPEHDLRYMYYVYMNIFSYKFALCYENDHFLWCWCHFWISYVSVK